jgi:hypothetical protein
VQISISENPEKDLYLLIIEDNGTGMETSELKKATDPFYTSRTTRKVGLGLPLIQMNVERTGGNFELDSHPGAGTQLKAGFVLSHPDRLPLGEIGEVLVLLAVGLPGLRLIYNHTTPWGAYQFDSDAIQEIVGDLGNCTQEIRKFLKEMIMENLQEIKAEA